MGANRTVVVLPTSKSAKIIKWKVREGTVVDLGRVILLYDLNTNGDDGGQNKLKATEVGTVRRLIAKEGEILSPGEPLLEIEKGCSHPTVIIDLCAECGADLRKEESSTPQASVPMIHSVPELKVSKEQAELIGKADEDRLLKTKKLVLLVDLDQTLIHTTNDEIPNNIKDVYHFQLHRNSQWYHTRLRPGTHNFLTQISEYYELHICTFGARNYAHMIAHFLDPDGKFFSHRILSRDECFDPNSKTANLKALFPVGDRLVCIIDDREDVWHYAPNLIHVKPYHFFKHTSDINAPPGLTKQENDDSESGFDFSTLAKGIKMKKKVIKPLKLSDTGSDTEEGEVKDTVKAKISNEGKNQRKSETEGGSDSESNFHSNDEKHISCDSPDLSHMLPTIKEDMMEVDDEGEPKSGSESQETKTEKEIKTESAEANSHKDSEIESTNIIKVDGSENTNTESTEIIEAESSETSDAKCSLNTGPCENVTKSDETSKAESVTVVEAEPGKVADFEKFETEEKTSSKICDNENSALSIEGIEGEVKAEVDLNKVENTDEKVGEDEKMELDSVKNDKENIGDVGEESSSSELSEKDKINITDSENEKKFTELSTSCDDDKPESSEKKEVTETRKRELKKKKKTENKVRFVEDKTENNKELIELEETDDYLLYLEEILKHIHRSFYSEYEATEGAPDLKKIIPKVKKEVLKGASLVFSGVVPTHIKLETTRAYLVAVSLGAEVTKEIEDRTTHVVAVRNGTSKVNTARRKKHINIVTPDWLWQCAERWEKVDERLYPVDCESKPSRHPPAHCCSPEHSPNREVQNPNVPQTAFPVPDDRFMHSIYPMFSFSSEDIESMKGEVEDISDGSESETEEKVEKPIIVTRTLENSQDSSNASSTSSSESLSGDHVRGWNSRKRRREATDTEIEEADGDDDEEESISSKFRRGEALPSDLDLGEDSVGSDEPPDEISDQDWNMLGAALEKEFLEGD